MKTIAFSIKGLLVAVTVIAVGLFALLNPSALWVSIIVSLTLLGLLTALLAVLCHPGPQRAFWGGFAIFGWGYFLSVYTPLGESYKYPLPTHAALQTLYKAVSSEVTEDLAYLRITRPLVGNSPKAQRFVARPPKLYFYRIGHCLWAWLFALIGGFLARYFYLAQEQRRSRAME